MSGYSISGESASLGPIRQTWQDVYLGETISGDVVIFPQKNVLLEFSECDLSFYRQWEGIIEATSGGSVTTTLLDQNSLSFRAFRGAFASLEKRPDISHGIAATRWSIALRGIVPQPDAAAILLEDGVYYLLQEDNSYLLLE